MQAKLLNFSIRVAVGLALGFTFAWALSEFSFQALENKESVQRDSRRVEIVIPYGTAEQVKRGITNPALPEDLVLIEGDLLVVKNEDIVDHQLGPMWIPAKTANVLSLDTADNYNYECSFQPSKLQGLDVRPRVSGNTRFQAMLAIALPTGMMLAVYSYLLPERKKPLRVSNP